MLAHITFEKVEEVIRLAERARDIPDGRADDPKRGGPTDDIGVTRPPPPREPHPDWRRAFRRYLHDLSDPAVSELVGLYRHGRGEADTATDAIAASMKAPPPHADQVAHLLSTGPGGMLAQGAGPDVRPSRRASGV